MNSEHVEVLERLRERCAALDAAIASLSAPQPPAEAQAQGGGEVAYFRKEMLRRCRDYAAGMTGIGADPADLEAALAPLLAPPSAPVGVAEAMERAAEEIERYGHQYISTVGASRVIRKHMAALAQQPAAADEATRHDAERYRWLRDSQGRPGERYPYKVTVRLPTGYSHPNELDAAIDQARRKEARNG